VKLRSFLLALLLFVFGLATTFGQNSPPFQTDGGVKPYQTYDGIRENISIATGNVNLNLPLVSLPGRNGHDFNLSATYNSQLWSATANTPGQMVWSLGVPGDFGSIGRGWRLSTDVLVGATGSVSLNSGQDVCAAGYRAILGDGSTYSFSGVRTSCNYTGCNNQSGCTPRVPSLDQVAGLDDSGRHFLLDTIRNILVLPDGGQITYSGSAVVDSNGNVISRAGSGAVDTLGRAITYILPSSGTPPYTGISYLDSDGTSRTISFQYTSLALNCTFPLPTPISGLTVTQPSGSIPIVSAIILPNGLSYTFQYNGCAELTKITYPAGGYARYEYANFTHLVGVSGFEVSATVHQIIAKHVCRASTTPAGATTASAGNSCPVNEDTTNYLPTSGTINNSSTSVTDPLGNATTYQFTQGQFNPASATLQPAAEISRTIYQGASTVLRTVQTAYGTGNTALYPSSRTTILPNGLQSQIQWDYQPGTDNVTEQREYDYSSSGTLGPLLRKTVNTWMTVNPVNGIDYTAFSSVNTPGPLPGLNIWHKKSSEKIYDGAGNLTAQTTYEYDNYRGGIAPSGAGSQHGTSTNSYSPDYTTRGNLTATNEWRNTDGIWLSTTYQYDDAGNILRVTDPMQHDTSYSYTDSWDNASCAPTGSAGAGTVSVSGSEQTITVDPCQQQGQGSCPQTVPDGGMVTITVDTFQAQTGYGPGISAQNLASTLTGLLNASGSPVTASLNNTTISLKAKDEGAFSNYSLTANVASTSSFSGFFPGPSFTALPSGSALTGGSGAGAAAAYRTTVTNSLGHQIKSTYNSCTGTVASATDANNQVTTFAYDLMDRRIATNTPDLGQTSVCFSDTVNASCYNSSLPIQVVKTTKITDNTSKISTAVLDGFGRVVQTQLNSDPTGADYVDITYDALERTAARRNPHRSTYASTDGTVQVQYDALNRNTQITRQDGSISTFSYSGNCTTSTDETGQLRKTCSDAIGRLVEVDEPGGTSSATGTKATASINVSGGFNPIWTGASPMHPAAIGTALSSVIMADSSSHTFYFDTNYHLCHLYWNSTSGWSNQDLTEQTEAGVAQTGSAVSAVVFGSALHVFYQGANQHIYNMEWTGTVWQNLDLTVLTGVTAISGTKLSAVVSGPNSPALFYEGTNQHFFMVYWVASSSVWSNADMSSITGQTTLMATNSSVSSGINGSGFYGFYLGTNQHLITIYWSGSAWLTADVTALSGGALATAGSALTTLSIGAGSSPMMTFYEGPSQHIYSIYWTTTSVWQTLDFTSFSGATNVAAAATALTNSNPSIQAFYFGSNQHIDDINWNGSAWVNSDLTSLSGATVTAATGSSLSAHGTSAGNTYHVFSTGSDQHIYDTYYTPSPAGWHNADLFGLANNYVIDSGTVSLTIPNGTSNFTATVCYGASTKSVCAGKAINASSTDIANALVSILNGTGSPVTATATGTNINLTWRTVGYNVETIPPMTSASDNPSLFPNGSFASTTGTFGGGANIGSQTLTNPLVTLYKYNTLGNLYCVEQHGTAATGTACPASPLAVSAAPVQPDPANSWRTRLFAYDSLSRLLWASNPESGVITYNYDADGNLLQKTSPAPNQGGTINQGTATQTVNYCYDALNRTTGKSYGTPSCPLATPVVTYAYDSGAYAKGKLSSLTDQAGTASFTYDVLGRIATETRTLVGSGGTSISKSMSYEYDLDSSLSKLHYPSGAIVTYTPDSAGRMVSAIDSANGIKYATGATYGPDGALTGFVSGNSATFAGVNNAYSYNQRLQPVTMSATAPSQTVYSIGYDFHAGTGVAASGNDNGNVFGIYNYKDNNRNQTFTYDSLNRLTSAQNAGTDCTVHVLQNKLEYWGNTYSYDAWGNLLNESKISSACAGEGLSVTADAHNWIHTSAPDYQYDGAGNMTFNATPPAQAYNYDQENRLTSAGGYTYTYDTEGKRVIKSNGTIGVLYWYMTPGIMAESDLSGNTISEYVFFNGQRVARRDGVNGAGGVFYYFSDHLKTASVITDASGNIKAESDHYPWGGELQFTNSDSNHYKFIGKERDTESGNDYLGARYYASTMGRLLSADPIIISSAHLENPQRWNEYSYGLNNPLINVDIDGRFSTDGHKAITTAGFRRAGLNPDSHFAREVLAANHAVDTGHYVGIVQAQLGPQHQSDHFLKAPEPENQIGAYKAAMSKIHGQADAAYSAIKANGLDSAADNIGTALHTIQDSYAHTQRDSSGAIVQVDCFTCEKGLGTGTHTHNDPDATNPNGSLTDPANAAANATSSFLNLMGSANQLTQDQFEQQYQQYVNTYFRERLQK
jgi:RHS repeat-associated protein